MSPMTGIVLFLQIVAEEPNKNYFSPLMAIPKTINAVWELIRSFIIGHSRGKEYKEGWFLRAFRVLGLIVPGVSAHGPQDYVNSTRLGSSALLITTSYPNTITNIVPVNLLCSEN